MKVNGKEISEEQAGVFSDSFEAVGLPRNLLQWFEWLRADYAAVRDVAENTGLRDPYNCYACGFELTPASDVMDVAHGRECDVMQLRRVVLPPTDGLEAEIDACHAVALRERRDGRP